jgi:hypothetical protein
MTSLMVEALAGGSVRPMQASSEAATLAGRVKAAPRDVSGLPSDRCGPPTRGDEAYSNTEFYKTW